GLLVRSESLAAGGTGAQTATWSFVVPFTPDSGTIVFTGGARAGSARSNGVTSVSVRDSVPPTLLNVVTYPSDHAEVGESLQVYFTARDNAAIAAMVVSWSGVVSGVDSQAFPMPKAASRGIRIGVPTGSALGQPLHLTFRAYDVARQAAARVVDLATGDTRSPWATGTMTSSAPYLVGDQ